MCTCPRTVIHPSLNRKFKSSGVTHAFLDGEIFPCSNPFVFSSYFERKGISSPIDTVVLNNKYYLFNPETGYTIPLFFNCPCGKCDECLYSKYTELTARLQFECLSHPIHCRPIFFTLTYDKEHLPPNGVSREDVSDFVNKIHIYCGRNGLNTNFRHFIVSEYGSDPRYTRRAHYHGIIFGLDLTRPFAYRDFNNAFHNSWQRCAYRRAQWEFANSSHGICRYVTKYVAKGLIDGNVPSGKNPNFISYPMKSGGLGSLALKNPDILSKILNSTTGSICVPSIDYVNGVPTLTTEHIRIPRFLIDKLFPPYCRYFTSNIRRCLQWVFKSYNRSFVDGSYIHMRSLLPLKEKFSSFFKELKLDECFMEETNPLSCRINSFYSLSSDKNISIFNRIYDYLMNYKYDDAFVRERCYSRDCYLSSFMRFKPKLSCDKKPKIVKFISSCLETSSLDCNLVENFI